MIFITLQTPALAGNSVTLAWDQSPACEIAGYKLFYGTASRAYTSVISLGAATSITIDGLTPGTTYFFAVAAYDAFGAQGDYSDELSYAVPIPLSKLQIRSAADGQVLLHGTGRTDQAYDVLATQDFAVWTAIGTVTADASGFFQFIDPVAKNHRSRFYRLHEIMLPTTPPVVQIRLLAGVRVELSGTGQIGHTYNVLATWDFGAWRVIGTVIADVSGSFRFIDRAGTGYRARFYRLHDVTYGAPSAAGKFEPRQRPDGKAPRRP